MDCDYSPCLSTEAEVQPKAISGSMSLLQKILTEQIPKWDYGTMPSSKFKKAELGERPPTPIDWESNILEGLDVLAVPQWTDQVKVTSSSCKNNHEEGFREMKAVEESYVINNVRTSKDDLDSKDTQRPLTRHQRRMLHQIQSDLLVKEELVSHIERSQAEFMAMRNAYEEKLRGLRDQISELQQEKRASSQSPDRRIRRLSNQLNVTTIMPVSATTHEVEIKNLAGEIEELRKKYNQCLSATHVANAKNEKQFHNYRLTIEYMKLEKKRLQNCIKEQGEKIKQLEDDHRTEMTRLQLERENLMDSQVKLSRDLQMAKTTLKKKSEEAMQVTYQLKQMTPILDRACKNGFVFEEIPVSMKSKLVSQVNNPVTTRHSKSDGTTKTRAMKKKQNLERIVQQYVQADRRALEYKQLLIKHNMIFMERSDLMSEAGSLSRACGQLVEAKSAELKFQIEDLTKALKLVREGIEAYQKQFSNTNSRPDPQASVSREFKGRNSIEQTSEFDLYLDRKGAYDRALSIVRSVNAEEGKLLSETLLKEVIVLKCRESSRDLGALQMDYTNQNLRKVVHNTKTTSGDDPNICESLEIVAPKRLNHTLQDSFASSPEVFEPTKQLAKVGPDQQLPPKWQGINLQEHSTTSLETLDLELKTPDSWKQESAISITACSDRPDTNIEASSPAIDLESDITPPPQATASQSVIGKRTLLRSFLKDDPDKETRTRSPTSSSSTLRNPNYNVMPGRRRWPFQTTYCTSESITGNGDTNNIFDRLASKHTLASHAKINARMYSAHTE